MSLARIYVNESFERRAFHFGASKIEKETAGKTKNKWTSVILNSSVPMVTTHSFKVTLSCGPELKLSNNRQCIVDKGHLALILENSVGVANLFNHLAHMAGPMRPVLTLHHVHCQRLQDFRTLSHEFSDSTGRGTGRQRWSIRRLHLHGQSCCSQRRRRRRRRRLLLIEEVYSPLPICHFSRAPFASPLNPDTIGFVVYRRLKTIE